VSHRAHALVLAAAIASGCQALDSAIPRQPAIADIPFAGDRPDAPPLEQRGNGTFLFASYDPSGKYLITVPFMGPPAGLISWDATTGELLSHIRFQIPMYSKPIWMLDGTRGRILAKESTGDHYRLVDLKSGQAVAELPDDPAADPKHPAFAVGLVADGNEVLLFKPGWLEVWQLDPMKLVRRRPSPWAVDHYIPGCVGGIPATYNDQRCWEWSPDRRTIAVADTPVFSPTSPTQFQLIDATTLDVQELTLPPDDSAGELASFAFSPDNRWLAIGLHRKMLLYDRIARSWGASVQGDHKRSPLVGPMRFTADSRRVITLEDQLQVSVYDVATGARLGRHVPAFENWEGAFKVSDDGSRIVIYKFVSDTFEVLDGNNAARLGFVCPYFCNLKHNPADSPYAVSPDGRSVAISQRRGTAIWDTATDTIRVALRDPLRKPLPYPYGK